MKINQYRPADHHFLSSTTHIAKPPKQLYVLGTLPPEGTKSVAIVGSRRPTAYGRDVTKTIAGGLATRGVAIISGMAIGVDTIAHTAALDVGGKTYAILPSGVENPYPRSNHSLARNIIQQHGALISENPAGTEPMQFRFLERNRLVSALADALIVTEAAIRSGTLSTVTHALEQGKPVFAVPGNITSPMSSGCNHLIKQGATPLTDIEDVLEVLGIQNTAESATAVFGDTEQESTILSLIQNGVIDGEELLARSQLKSQEFSETMTMLEIKGMITPLGNNQWRL